MPRTRSETDREAKVAQILDGAEQQLRGGGLEHLSVAALARTLGVAQNSIYWYFPSRDHLLVAVLYRVAKRWLHELADLGSDRYVDQIIGVVDRLADFEPLATLVTSERSASPVLTAFGHELEQSLCGLLRETLRPHVSESRLEMVADAVLTLARGALARGLPQEQRTTLLSFTIHHLVDADPGPLRRPRRRRTASS
jgi:AcrR family transcriptional regulator